MRLPIARTPRRYGDRRGWDRCDRCNPIFNKSRIEKIKEKVTGNDPTSVTSVPESLARHDHKRLIHQLYADITSHTVYLVTFNAMVLQTHG